MSRTRELPDRSHAETVAIAALAFVADDPKLLPRFLAVTGLDPASIRLAAGEAGFLAGVLDFVLAHEPTLMEFADTSGMPPQSIADARRLLTAGERNEAAS